MNAHRKHQLDEQSMLMAAVNDNQKHISECLNRDMLHNLDHELMKHVMTMMVAQTDAAKEEIGKNFPNVGNSEAYAHMLGIHHATGFLMMQAGVIMRYRRTPHDSLGNQVAWDSKDKLAEAMIELLQIMLLFHKMSNYILDVAGTSEDDPGPELRLHKDCKCIASLYSDLAEQIPEYGASLVAKPDQN